MNRSSKQKINKEIVPLNDTLDQMAATNVFRIFHPNTAEYIFFSSAHGTFSRIGHILGHKTSLSKFKKINVIAYIISFKKILFERVREKVQDSTAEGAVEGEGGAVSPMRENAVGLNTRTLGS